MARRGAGNCSGLPERTTLRRFDCQIIAEVIDTLFRLSRPDYIEAEVGISAAGSLRFLIPVF